MSRNVDLIICNHFQLWENISIASWETTCSVSKLILHRTARNLTMRNLFTSSFLFLVLNLIFTYTGYSCCASKQLCRFRNLRLSKLGRHVPLGQPIGGDITTFIRRHNTILHMGSTEASTISSVDVSEEFFLNGLSDVQRSIVTADLNNIRVQAGPGSGKTRWRFCENLAKFMSS